MRLYAVIDKKSSCSEYFIASCDEDAMRVFGVMMMSSRPMYEYADDYMLSHVMDLPDVRAVVIDDTVVIDGFEVRRQLDARRKERENAKA